MKLTNKQLVVANNILRKALNLLPTETVNLADIATIEEVADYVQVINSNIKDDLNEMSKSYDELTAKYNTQVYINKQLIDQCTRSNKGWQETIQEADKWKQTALTCVYCSTEFYHVDLLKNHLDKCEKHPAHTLKPQLAGCRTIEEIETAVKEAVAASYAYPTVLGIEIRQKLISNDIVRRLRFVSKPEDRITFHVPSPVDPLFIICIDGNYRQGFVEESDAVIFYEGLLSIIKREEREIENGTRTTYSIFDN